MKSPVTTPSAVKTCLCAWWGPRGGAGGPADKALFEPILSHVLFDADGGLGLPKQRGQVEVVGLNNRNSDERSWAARVTDVLEFLFPNS